MWQVLLIRGLKPATDENLLAKGLEKLYLDNDQSTTTPSAMPMAPGMPPRQPTPLGATHNTLKRVFLIRDRTTDKSLGYGFAEYHSVADAKAALAKAESMGSNCTISSKQIDVCHPHFGIFMPELDFSRGGQQYLVEFNGQSLKYRDNRYYASSFTVNDTAPAPLQSEQTPAKETTTKAKKRSKTEAMGTLDKPSAPAKKAKKASEMVNILNRAQAQARGEDEAAETNEANPNPEFLSGTNHEYSTIGDGWQQSFAFDGERGGKRLVCCLLCNVMFPDDPAKLSRHVELSQKHAENYKDGEKFNQGLKRMKGRSVAEDETLKVLMKSSTDTEKEDDPEKKEEQAEYRDRAAERRKEEAKERQAGGGNQPSGFKSMSLKGIGQKGKGGNQQAPATPAPIGGIGKKLLEKQGWQDGQALGSGDGITAPIEQNVYAMGVGLGHEGSKKGDAIEEAGRQTRNDRSDFGEKTWDTARKRFEEMR